MLDGGPRMINVDIQVSELLLEDIGEAHGLSLALDWPYRLEDWAFAHALGEGVALRNNNGGICGYAVTREFGRGHVIGTEEAMVCGILPEPSPQARIFALCSNSLG